MKVVHELDGVKTLLGLQDGALISGSEQDCTPYLEEAQARHNAGNFGTSELKHAASIPNIIIEQYMNLNGVDFREVMTNPIHFKRMLNDPDLKGFRIWPGKI